MSKPVVQVAIALLFHHTKVLVGWRNAQQHQGNKYEFPGGKVEPNETPLQACTREIQEEVGIVIETWYPFDVIRHEYEDIEVHLHIFKGLITENKQCLEVEDHINQIHSNWRWYQRSDLSLLNFPKANQAIIRRLMPAQYIKVSADLSDLSHLAANTQLYLRHPCTEEVLQQLNQLEPTLLSNLIVNVEIWSKLSHKIQHQVSAVHYNHAQLMNMSVEQMISGINTIAACHDQQSLQHAQALGMDAVILSPVLNTQTHPDVQGMGWKNFQQLTDQLHIPVYALGGLSPNDLNKAQQYGAYGVAGIRQF